MTNISYEREQNGSVHEYKFYCCYETTEEYKIKYISHMVQNYSLRKTIVGSYF